MHEASIKGKRSQLMKSAKNLQAWIGSMLAQLTQKIDGLRKRWTLHRKKIVKSVASVLRQGRKYIHEV